MNRIIEQERWPMFVQEFSRNNHLRSTRLEVLDEAGALTEEHGLPFDAMDLEMKDTGGPQVEILLGGEGERDPHLAHRVEDVVSIALKVGPDGRDEALKIASADKTSTLVTLGDVIAIAS